MTNHLALREASIRLGVSTSTFKRLCDRYSVELDRTPGGHRRVSESALEELSRKVGVSNLKRKNGFELQDDLSTDIIIELLLTRRASELVDRVVAACKLPRDIAAVIDQSLAPAMWHLGTMWRRGELQVFQVHLCTETIIRSIHLMEHHFRSPPNACLKAVGGTLNQAGDTIASKLVALTLNSIGVDAHDLGPRVPADEIAAAAHALDTCLVWCSSTHWDNQSDVIDQHLLLRRLLPRETPILIGGGGLSLSAQQALDSCHFFETLQDMVNFVQTLAFNETSAAKAPMGMNVG